jgi:asparagine synthase (glutamine-hydrolysing)
MRHRGPDGDGIHLEEAVGLGHRRLSIIDLSSNGSQPMCNEDRTIWIVFNGEIYNYLELRDQLAKRGHTFRSMTDTEVIVHLYEEYGIDCVRHLRGMFAFAVWDTSHQRLFLARDRVGIKPLYYCQTANAIWFASELKAILVDPAVARDISLPAIRQFLSFYYLPGEETLFQSIKKLSPGHHLTVERGKVSISQYWDLHFDEDRYAKSFEEAAGELHNLLESTVTDHMIADVPVGVLLSGGVDSSAVLSFAVRNTKKTIKTFTVGFDGGKVVDERFYARLVAERFGTEHYDLSISARDFWEFLPSYVRHMEEPVCEPPAVALYYVSKLAREHVKVLLSGEGGDEAFAGYSNYVHLLRLERMRSALGPFSRPAGILAGLLGRCARSARLSRYGAALGRPLPVYYFSRTSGPTAFFNDRSSRVFSPEFLSAVNGADPAATMRELLSQVRGNDLLDQMLFADTKTWLPDDLLVKADKMTMANSVELRVPLLDHKVLEFAASLPAPYKVLGSQGKRVLKAAFARILPPEILSRKKAGFPVPFEGWLREQFPNAVQDILLSTQARARGYFRAGSLQRLLDRNRTHGTHAREVFSLLVLELWHREFVDRSGEDSRPRSTINSH